MREQIKSVFFLLLSPLVDKSSPTFSLSLGRIALIASLLTGQEFRTVLAVLAYVTATKAIDLAKEIAPILRGSK